MYEVQLSPLSLKHESGLLILCCFLFCCSLFFSPAVARSGIPDQRSSPIQPGKLMAACAKCHGPNGEGSEDGKYPRLAGIPAKYLARQLRLFQSWERESTAMNPCLTEQQLSADEVTNISVHISKIKISLNVADAAGDVEAGKKLYIRKCKKCHGKNGIGKGFKPRLSGQYSQYLRHAIADYTSGKRKYSMMKRYFEQMTPADIENVLAYLTSRDD